MFPLAALGWSESFAASFAPHAAAGLLPARVALQHKHAYTVLAAAGEFTATCTGRLLHHAATTAALPAVGDWVAVQPRPAEAHADIHAVLPRRTCFSRRAAGDAAAQQVVAANVDTVLLVSALDRDFNLRRIERYLAAAWESGARPVIVLNKADLHPDPAAAQAEVQSLVAGVPVVLLSAAPAARSSDAPYGNTERLAPWLEPGTTVALLGSSGVGKSTLVNRLLDHDRQRTGALSDVVHKGRHTTTHRELLVASAGFLLLDTPGLRELQLWETPAAAVDTTFADVAALVARCRFTDCRHGHEPGCAVVAALAAGTLAPDRWQSFLKLSREQAYAARRADPRLARASRDAWKKLSRTARSIGRLKRDGFHPDA
jgi:ribosome biogenesis GTPase